MKQAEWRMQQKSFHWNYCHETYFIWFTKLILDMKSDLDHVQIMVVACLNLQLHFLTFRIRFWLPEHGGNKELGLTVRVLRHKIEKGLRAVNTTPQNWPASKTEL